MKLFSKMLSKKIEPSELGDIDLEKLRGRSATADDTGETNPTADADFADKLKSLPDPAPEVEMGAGWGDDAWDDDWDDDDDWGAEDDPDLDDDPAVEEEEKAQLVDEIREAMSVVGDARSETSRPRSVAPSRPRSVSGDAEFRDWDEESLAQPRRIVARSRLENTAGETDRMFEETASKMGERETSRRRSAMAHLKAAAAATKADKVLKNVASRDPASDPEEQSPYRDDLAKVVRPHSTSRPISRMVSRPTSQTATWDTGMADDDAAKFAEAEEEATNHSAAEEMAAAEEERLAKAPLDLSEDEFAHDGPTGLDADEVLESAFSSDDEELDTFEPDEPEFDDEDDGPVPSRVVSDAVAFAQGDDNTFEDDEHDDEPVPSSAVADAVAFAQGIQDDFDDDDVEEEDYMASPGSKKIWEAADEVAAQVNTAREAAGEPEDLANVAAMVSGRAAGRAGAGRVKTRLLGFQPEVQERDVFEAKDPASSGNAEVMFPAGWIVVVSGPGRGRSFALHNGVSQIGRGEDQAVRLDFGDTSISRNNHAAVAFDDEQGKFFLGHGGKSNLVRLNDKPVLSTEEMSDGDMIRIGETTLKFVALCGENFSWKDGEDA